MTDINLKEEINQLKENMFSDDWKTVKISADRLGKIGGKEVTDFLISLLDLNNPDIRNRAALALEDIKDNRALDPLLNAIFKKENHNYNGTMVFALESLDCSKKLKEIFKILFFETYESKISAYAILCDQTFDFTEQDLVDVQQMWEECKLEPAKCPGYDDEETRSMMQDAVEKYTSYLKPNHNKPSS
jgi:HEAT repeat protein